LVNRQRPGCVEDAGAGGDAVRARRNIARKGEGCWSLQQMVADGRRQ
jgi:hypothetical protein